MEGFETQGLTGHRTKVSELEMESPKSCGQNRLIIQRSDILDMNGEFRTEAKLTEPQTQARQLFEKSERSKFMGIPQTADQKINCNLSKDIEMDQIISENTTPQQTASTQTHDNFSVFQELTQINSRLRSLENFNLQLISYLDQAFQKLHRARDTSKNGKLLQRNIRTFDTYDAQLSPKNQTDVPDFLDLQASGARTLDDQIERVERQSAEDRRRRTELRVTMNGQFVRPVCRNDGNSKIGTAKKQNFKSLKQAAKFRIRSAKLNLMRGKAGGRFIASESGQRAEYRGRRIDMLTSKGNEHQRSQSQKPRSEIAHLENEIRQDNEASQVTRLRTLENMVTIREGRGQREEIYTGETNQQQTFKDEISGGMASQAFPVESGERPSHFTKDRTKESDMVEISEGMFTLPPSALSNSRTVIVSRDHTCDSHHGQQEVINQMDNFIVNFRIPGKQLYPLPESCSSIPPETPMDYTNFSRQTQADEVLMKSNVEKIEKIIERATDRNELALSLVGAVFTRMELAASNTSGSHGKRQLDSERLQFVKDNSFARFPPTDGKDIEEIWRGILDKINTKCRGVKRNLKIPRRRKPVIPKFNGRFRVKNNKGNVVTMSSLRHPPVTHGPPVAKSVATYGPPMTHQVLPSASPKQTTYAPTYMLVPTTISRPSMMAQPSPPVCTSELLSGISLSSIDHEEVNKLIVSANERDELALNLAGSVFTRVELATSNTSGSHGKQKLDDIRLAFIRDKIFERFPAPEEKDVEDIWKGVLEKLNSKCRGVKRNLKLSLQMKQAEKNSTVTKETARDALSSHAHATVSTIQSSGAFAASPLKTEPLVDQSQTVICSVSTVSHDMVSSDAVSSVASSSENLEANYTYSLSTDSSSLDSATVTESQALSSDHGLSEFPTMVSVPGQAVSPESSSSTDPMSPKPSSVFIPVNHARIAKLMTCAADRDELALTLAGDLFTRIELANSNVRGTHGKNELDKSRLDFIKEKVFEQFPEPDRKRMEYIWKCIIDKLNTKCRGAKRTLKYQSLSMTSTILD